MNLEFQRLMRGAEGRYLTHEEAFALEGYGQGLERRIDTLRAVERAEDAILDDVVAGFEAKFGDMSGRHGPDAGARIRRDQMMVLRYAVMAMLIRDPDFIREKLSLWLRTILFALNDPEQIRYGNSCLVDACRRHLTEADATELLPFLETHNAEFSSGRSEAVS